MSLVRRLLDAPTDPSRRRLLRAVPLLLAAPAIVKFASLMPVKVIETIGEESSIRVAVAMTVALRAPLIAVGRSYIMVDPSWPVWETLSGAERAWIRPFLQRRVDVLKAAAA